jgi:hypothetical protein
MSIGERAEVETLQSGTFRNIGAFGNNDEHETLAYLPADMESLGNGFWYECGSYWQDNNEHDALAFAYSTELLWFRFYYF